MDVDDEREVCEDRSVYDVLLHVPAQQEIRRDVMFKYIYFSS